MGTKNAPITGAMFSSQCAQSLVLYSTQQWLQDWLYESCFAFTPVLCFVITAFSEIKQCSCRKQSSNLVWFTCERVCMGMRLYQLQSDHESNILLFRTRQTFLLLQPRPRPTSSFHCLQRVKQIIASYPGRGYNSAIPKLCNPPPPPTNTCQCRNTASLASFPGLRHPQFSLGLCKSLFMFSAIFHLC